MFGLFKKGKKRIIKTKIKGVSFNNSDGTSRQKILKKCRKGESLILKHDPLPGHPNAVSINRKSGDQLGYVSDELCAQITKAIKSKQKVSCKILELTGGGFFRNRTRGCNIEISISQHKSQL